MGQFADLPQQLKPNEDGLSIEQFKVYEDFAHLNQIVTHNPSTVHSSIFSDPSLSSLGTAAINQAAALLDPSDDIEAYLKQFEVI